jgi:hypothetical protein
VRFFRRRGRPRDLLPARQTLVMTSTHDEDGLVHRAVHLEPDGSLAIVGHDIGPGVERILGLEEYEFRRSLAPEQTEQLRDLLDARGADLLAVIEQRFANTAELERFIAEHDLSGSFWNWMTD